jgi:hypothetical protein
VKASPATPDKSLSHSRCNLVTGTEKKLFRGLVRRNDSGLSVAALRWGSALGKIRRNFEFRCEFAGRNS